MPFEFTGLTPALLNTSSTFSSFAPPSHATTPASTTPSASKSFSGPVRPQSSSGFGVVSSFGVAPVFGASSSFGSSLKPTFESTPSWSSSSHPERKTSNSQSSGLSAVATTREPPPNDVLTQALDRAFRGKLAIFGRGDIAADDILKSIFRGNKDEIQALTTGLREVETSSPAVSTFIRALFDESIRRQTLQVQQLAEATPPPKALGQQSAEETPAAEGSNAAEEILKDINDEYPTASLYADHPPIPRDHWRVKTFSARLAELLLDEGYIWYEEGSRVLADYIIELTRKHDQRAIVAKLVELLARQDNDGAVWSVVHWARRKMQDIERDYWQDLEDGRDTEQDCCQDGQHESDKRGGTLSDDDATSLTPHGLSHISEAIGANGKAREAAEHPVAKTKQKSFRFLDLPAELRNWVYSELMAPGHVGFDQRHCFFDIGAKNRIITRRTTCNARILTTCKQIYDEAKDVLYENTVCVTGSILEGMSPVIPQNLLPNHVLSRLTSLTVTIVTIRTSEAKTPFGRLNWKQFQHMTSLKKLRICVVEREDQIGETNEKKRVLEDIIERVPKDCELAFETREGFEDEIAQGIIEQLDVEKARNPTRGSTDAYEVEGELLSTLAEEFKSKQGCKSGSSRDFRFPERSIKLSPLLLAREMDPSLVLGGSQ